MKFYKYHGTGNDFILSDQREETTLEASDRDAIAALCRRRFGVGADGFIMLQSSEEADFHMAYFNADGLPSSMCGNGGRCVVAFAKRLGVFQGDRCTFTAPDGLHEAELLPDGRVALQMKDVPVYRRLDDDAYFLDTGSPHHVCFVPNPDEVDVFARGRSIRYAPIYDPEGTNVNFVAAQDGCLRVRTYERGVEAETYSCGTGVVAAALAYWLQEGAAEGTHVLRVSTKGGTLEVRFTYHTSFGFRQIWLIGPAEPVFEFRVL